MAIEFSIIVPMRNERRYVAETLLSLLRQDFPCDRLETIVVDAGSTDGSREIVARLAAEHPHLRLLDNPGIIAAAGRNVGIRAARGRFIGIVDCHSFVSPDFLATARRLFDETGADCLGRPVELFLPGDSYLQRVTAAARHSWLGHNLTSSRYARESGATSPLSVGILYRREVFARIGLFNEQLGACEDVEFNYRVQRAGLRTWTDPALRAYYHPRPSLWGLFQQLRRYAYWRYRLLRVQPGAFHAAQAAPAAGAAVGGLAVLTAAAGPLPEAVPVALAVSYGALVGAASLAAARRRGLRYLPLLPAAFGAIHLGAAVGFWAGMVEEGAGRVARIGAGLAARLRLRGAESRQ